MRRLLATLIVLLVLTGCEQANTPCPAPGPSLFAFHATWCQPCQRDKPLLDEVRSEFPVMDVDFDSQHDIAVQYRVQVLPFYIVIVDGQEAFRTMNLREAIRALRLNQQ